MTFIEANGMSKVAFPVGQLKNGELGARLQPAEDDSSDESTTAQTTADKIETLEDNSDYMDALNNASEENTQVIGFKNDDRIVINENGEYEITIEQWTGKKGENSSLNAIIDNSYNFDDLRESGQDEFKDKTDEEIRSFLINEVAKRNSISDINLISAGKNIELPKYSSVIAENSESQEVSEEDTEEKEQIQEEKQEEDKISSYNKELLNNFGITEIPATIKGANVKLDGAKSLDKNTLAEALKTTLPDTGYATPAAVAIAKEAHSDNPEVLSKLENINTTSELVNSGLLTDVSSENKPKEGDLVYMDNPNGGNSHVAYFLGENEEGKAVVLEANSEKSESGKGVTIGVYDYNSPSEKSILKFVPLSEDKSIETNKAENNQSNNKKDEAITEEGTSVEGDKTSDKSGQDFKTVIENSSLKGSILSEQADFIEDTCNKYGVDPNLAISIMYAETGGDSYALTVQNNPGGIMDWDQNWNVPRTFSSIENGIDFVVKNIKNNYLNMGLDTIQEISEKYCPIGASNDPNGLNVNWVGNVIRFYNSITGKNIDANSIIV